MNVIWTYLQNNGTKLLAALIGTLGIIQTSTDIVPAAWGKYITLIIAILVYWRGMANTQAIATAVTQQHANAIALGTATGTAPVLAPAGTLDYTTPVIPTVHPAPNAIPPSFTKSTP